MICKNCNGTSKIERYVNFDEKVTETCEYCNGGHIESIEAFIQSRGVLTGSRAMGFANSSSDWDYAVTENEYNFIMKYVDSKDVTLGGSSNNRMMNERSSKFWLNSRQYNIIAYRTSECLEIIRNITSAVGLFPECEDKNIRNAMFETLCQMFITPKARKIPVIELDDDDIPF